MPAKLQPEDVRAAVEKFWRTFLGKDRDALLEFYALGSTAYQIARGRTDPGRLGATRRAREYFHPKTRLEVQLSAIDVLLVGVDAAVATYTFKFLATDRAVQGEKMEVEDIELVRATHVWHRDELGVLRIAHEHFSVPVS